MTSQGVRALNLLHGAHQRGLCICEAGVVRSVREARKLSGGGCDDPDLPPSPSMVSFLDAYRTSFEAVVGRVADGNFPDHHDGGQQHDDFHASLFAMNRGGTACGALFVERFATMHGCRSDRVATAGAALRSSRADASGGGRPYGDQLAQTEVLD
jgi:hypothetical protein